MPVQFGCTSTYCTMLVVQDYVKSLKNNGDLLDKLAWEDDNSAAQVSFLLIISRLAGEKLKLAKVYEFLVYVPIINVVPIWGR